MHLPSLCEDVPGAGETAVTKEDEVPALWSFPKWREMKK